jgi:hypothetical protein
MGNWEVDADLETNRLYLTLEGHMDADEVEAAADAVVDATERLDEGFDEVNDMSSFKPSGEEAMAHIERGKRATAENGCAAIVRIVSESPTGQMQFDRAGEDAESYAVAKAETVAEAEKLLDSRRE